jgi:DNA-binding NarL/FixJ family response regulator
VLAVPFLDQLVDARVAEGRLEDAAAAADAIAATAGPSSRERIAATAAFAHGRVAMARGDAAAVSELQKAINHYAVLGLRLDAARARLALARTLASDSPEIAIDTARQARNELDALGDSREADMAAALMRSLGAKGRAGPRAAGLLTQREIEVLRLLGEGLTNAEIAARLFISPKTAEHHVSRIFAKLGLAKRSEAAAYAVRYLEAE